jgi:hypothetical protein
MSNRAALSAWCALFLGCGATGPDGDEAQMGGAPPLDSSTGGSGGTEELQQAGGGGEPVSGSGGAVPPPAVGGMLEGDPPAYDFPLVKHNIPDATIHQTRVGAAQSLSLVSLGFVELQPLAEIFYQFYAELQNFGSEPVCNPSAQFAFKGADGTTVWTFEVAIDADSYYNPETGEATYCIAPGASGVVWSVEGGHAEPVHQKTASVDFTFSGDAVGANVTAPFTPVLRNAGLVDVGIGIDYEGQVVVGDLGASLVLVDLFLKTEEGYLVAAGADFGENLAAGEVWDFSMQTFAMSDTDPHLLVLRFVPPE